jgi:hypothetical protein
MEQLTYRLVYCRAAVRQVKCGERIQANNSLAKPTHFPKWKHRQSVDSYDIMLTITLQFSMRVGLSSSYTRSVYVPAR